MEECQAGYDAFNFFIPATRVREFLWNLFAPHYVEMAKGRAYEGDPACLQALHTVMRTLLRLLAPIAPFIADYIWRQLYEGSVHRETLPAPREAWESRLRGLTEALVAFNSSVWREKKRQGLALKEEISGVALPKELVPFAEDLSRMHNIRW